MLLHWVSMNAVIAAAVSRLLERRPLLPAALTFERSDSGDSSMWRSSELSISSSMPVIFPARLRCMSWMRGKRRSPVQGKKHTR